MTIPSLPFNLAEKSAIVKLMYSVIIADGQVHPQEINAFKQFMHIFDFDSNFIQQANTISPEQGEMILTGMSSEKKELLADILEDMAKSDRFVHEKKTVLLKSIFASIAV